MQKLLILFAIFPLLVFAEENPAAKKGTLSSHSNLPKGDYSIDGPWEDLQLDSEEQAPLLSNVRKISSNEYEYSVTNNSEDRYSTNVGIIQSDANGKIIKKDYAMVNLKPGEKKTRKLRAGPRTASVALELKKWDKKEKVKSAQDLQEEIRVKKEELKELEDQLKALEN